MTVDAVRGIRKMRGGAQAHLLECEDGYFYVVKFQNNPQHRRILINEWIASVFLKYLEISVPSVVLVSLSPRFLAANPEVYIQLGSRHRAVQPGWHFGSRYPGDPSKMMSYDFLPDALLETVVNATDFLGVLAFDKWIGNADARQSIFFRPGVRQSSQQASEAVPRTGLIAQMIDHGYTFGGPQWNFLDSPLQGLYFRPSVYQNVQGWEDFQPWLDRIVSFPGEVVDSAQRQIPPEWLAEDATALRAMLLKLMSRRHRVPDLICDTRHGRADPFPKWK